MKPLRCIFIVISNLSLVMRKPDFCPCENKVADQLLSNLIQNVQPLSHFLCLYTAVCVAPVREPNCCFFHDVAHIDLLNRDTNSSNLKYPE